MKRLMISLSMIMLLSQAFSQSRLRVSVDPRIELLSVILSVSDYDSLIVSRESFPLVSRFDFKYKENLLSAFSEMKDDSVIDTFTEMLYNYGFAYSFPVQACLVSSDLPEMKINKIVNKTALSRSGGLENLNNFLGEMSDFYIRSDFDSFLKEHEDYYREIVWHVESLPVNEMVSRMEDYFGEQQSSYNIILASMFHPGGFGPNIYDSLGNKHVYSIIGPKSVSRGVPRFGTVDEFRYLVWHEFSHSVVNPIVDSLYDEMEPFSGLYDPLKEKLQHQIIGNWRDCIAEHIVRAVTVRLTCLYHGDKAGAEAMAKETGMGFSYVPDICRVLEDYEASRDVYPVFRDYYPRIIQLFSKLDGGMNM